MPATAEQRRFSKPEVKLVSGVTPEEIARRSGGDMGDWLRPTWIEYPGLDGHIYVGTLYKGEKNRAPHFYQNSRWPEGAEISLSLVDTAVVLGEDFVTFVFPPRVNLHCTSSADATTVSGIIISKKGVFIFTKPSGLVSEEVMRAARLTEEALKNRAQAV